MRHLANPSVSTNAPFAQRGGWAQHFVFALAAILLLNTLVLIGAYAWMTSMAGAR